MSAAALPRIPTCVQALLYSLLLLHTTYGGSPKSSHDDDQHHSSSPHASPPPSHQHGRTPIDARHYAAEKLIFSDDFNELDLSVWEHELTMGGGGNWEFELYDNRRNNSFVRSSILYVKPTLTADYLGEANVRSGYTVDMWGSSPADLCTGNSFYGCERTSGAGGNIVNPITSARIRTAQSMRIKYGRVEVSAKLPIGDWLWPAIWSAEA